MSFFAEDLVSRVGGGYLFVGFEVDEGFRD